MDQIEKARHALREDKRYFKDFTIKNDKVYATCVKCEKEYEMSGSNGRQHRSSCKGPSKDCCRCSAPVAAQAPVEPPVAAQALVEPPVAAQAPVEPPVAAQALVQPTAPVKPTASIPSAPVEPRRSQRRRFPLVPMYSSTPLASVNTKPSKEK